MKKLILSAGMIGLAAFAVLAQKGPIQTLHSLEALGYHDLTSGTRFRVLDGPLAASGAATATIEVEDTIGAAPFDKVLDSATLTINGETEDMRRSPDGIFRGRLDGPALKPFYLGNDIRVEALTESGDVAASFELENWKMN